MISEKEINYGSELFTEEQVIEVWKNYASKVKDTSGGFSGSVLANCQPKLKENQTLHVIFRNETNLQEFIKLSENLLNHLKSSLKNNNIQFETEVNKEKAKKILYTNREKFDHFAESYPKLKEWENKLGLELK